MQDLTIEEIGKILEGVSIFNYEHVDKESTVESLLEYETAEDEEQAQAMIQAFKQDLISIVESCDFNAGDYKEPIETDSFSIDGSHHVIVMFKGLDTWFETSY